MGIDTPLRVMTLNGRRSSSIPDKLSPTRRWSARRAPMISYLKKVAPWIIGGQEFTVTQSLDVIHGLGEEWNFIGGVKAGNCPLIYDTLKLDYVKDSMIELEMNSDRRKRYATLAQFAVRPTGEKCWIGTTHLAYGGVTERNPEQLRAKQMVKIGSTIEALPDHLETILCGDFNSPTSKSVTLDPIRKIAEQYGLTSIRRALKPDSQNLHGEVWGSHHGFGEKTKADYRWIDDVLTGAGVVLKSATLRRTCNYTYPRINPTDHNGIVAELVV